MRDFSITFGKPIYLKINFIEVGAYDSFRPILYYKISITISKSNIINWETKTSFNPNLNPVNHTQSESKLGYVTLWSII